MTRGDWFWLSFGGVCAAVGLVMMVGTSAGWWHL
jgi:hypothetical protein